MPATTACIIVNCITNLHAGAGDSGVGIIDALVQRDSISDLPIINASSIKGSQREYYEEGPLAAQLSEKADSIFGKMANDAAESGKGSHVFHEAMLLALPLGSNFNPFYRAISKQQLQKWVMLGEAFGKTFNAIKNEIESLPDVALYNPRILGDGISGLMIGDFENVTNVQNNYPELEKLFGMHILLVHHDDFKAICSDYDLPVIARNQLINGHSENLWYEQVVPHSSIFSFFVYRAKEEKYKYEDDIDKQIVQIGSNSSLGYGYCKLEKF